MISVCAPRDKRRAVSARRRLDERLSRSPLRKFALLLAIWSGMDTPSAATTDALAVVRYSVAVILDIDGQQVSGAAVWEGHFRFVKGPEPGSSSRLSASVLGQAIPLNVPGVGTVFVLRRLVDQVSREGAGAYIIYCTPPDIKFDSILDALPSFPACKLRGPRPMLVINTGSGSKPELRELPYRDKGGTVTLVELAITPTVEPITRGLQDDFPWIRSLPSIDLPGGGTAARFDTFYQIDFLREN